MAAKFMCEVFFSLALWGTALPLTGAPARSGDFFRAGEGTTLRGRIPGSGVAREPKEGGVSGGIIEGPGRGSLKEHERSGGVSHHLLGARSQIAQTVSGQLTHALTPQTVSGLSAASEIQQKASAKSEIWSLSWSHYLFLMGIKDSDARSFYEIEATSEGWSLRELRRQFDSGLYERLALSRDKESILALAREGQIVEKPEQLLKNPYVLEFLGLREETRYSERELETAIIDKLEHFLLELGKGFLFEARQKRFTFDEEHFFVDLVFYNRLLRCYVLLDLKIGELTHQDLGQMQMYVNYYDRHVKIEGEHPTVGIILCKKKKAALVELTLPKGNIHAAEYQLYLPSKEELRQKLIAWAEEIEG
jgi:predicted nuclease of restriction endonuclease-like (RecB) superfamily